VKYTVHIRNNATGEVREYRDNLDWHGSSLYWWSEGNMSCDCNREPTWIMAGGGEPPDNCDCGHSRFAITRIVLDDGTVFDDEDELNPFREVRQ
jgi:hypothetical protein